MLTINQERLLERFLRYVAVDTTAGEAPIGDGPSSPGQLVLGKLLRDELLALGLTDAEQDRHGIVTATIPATVDGAVPVLCFNSHVDTSPETTGANVKPNVIRSYAGGDIVLSGDTSKVIRTTSNPELNDLLGKTLITTDGTTLLGGDDKAGVAIIMEAAAALLENPSVPHGKIRVMFTCDEEIGHGVDHVDLEKLGADAAYTVDGMAAGRLDVETFSADGAVVTVKGVNIHPMIAKDRMINAIRAAGEFCARLPKETLAPERTDGRDGFIHPVRMEGGVAEVTIHLILRSFDTPALDDYRKKLESVAKEAMAAVPGSTITVATHAQYRNLADGLAKAPRVVKNVHEAYRRLNRPSTETIVRGGTDGSRLTELGLPTPNLSSGQHNPHSPLEWACLDEMVETCQVIGELVQVWAER
ncbi:MAG TPA: peptidase T [Candidatus Eisenbacteria bacterium]